MSRRCKDVNRKLFDLYMHAKSNEDIAITWFPQLSLFISVWR